MRKNTAGGVTAVRTPIDRTPKKYRNLKKTIIGVILFNQSVFASADIPEAVR